MSIERELYRKFMSESKEDADKDLFQLLDELEKIITSDPSKSLEILKDIEILLKNDQGKKSDKNSVNESKTIDDISTREIGAFLKTLNIKVGKVNLRFIADKLKEHFELDYKPSIIEVDQILDNMPKDYMESSVNESRNWTVVVKCSGPDNMNNIEIEDQVEELLDRAGLTVTSIDATRGE